MLHMKCEIPMLHCMHDTYFVHTYIVFVLELFFYSCSLHLLRLCTHTIWCNSVRVSNGILSECGYHFQFVDSEKLSIARSFSTERRSVFFFFEWLCNASILRCDTKIIWSWEKECIARIYMDSGHTAQSATMLMMTVDDFCLFVFSEMFSTRPSFFFFLKDWKRTHKKNIIEMILVRLKSGWCSRWRMERMDGGLFFLLLLLLFSKTLSLLQLFYLNCLFC